MRHRHFVGMCGLFILQAACPSDSNKNNGDTDTGDSRSGDMNPGDANPGDTNPGDTNPGDSSTPGDSFMCSSSCPSPAPTNAVKTLVIDSVDFATNTIVIRNTSGSPIDTAVDRVEFCDFPGYELRADLGTIVAGGTVSATLSNFNLSSSGGELAVYVQPVGGMPEHGTTSAPRMHAYVAWGATIQSRGDQAVVEGLWPSDTSVVELCATHTGLVATGNVTMVSGWDSVGSTCF